MTARRGFTLIEMLVATGVFLIGFSAAYSLFLVAMRNRALSDATMRGTLAATSQIATMRLYATHENANAAARYQPDSFIGDGDPRNGGEIGTATDFASVEFEAYPDDPSVFYRVISSTDLNGNSTNPDASGFRILILVGTLGNISSPQTLEDILTRFRIEQPATVDLAYEELLQLDSFQRFDAVLHRRAVW